MAEIIRNCINCTFVRTAELKGPDGKLMIGQKAHSCQRFPPAPVLLPGQQPGVVTLTPVFPIVNEGISCAEHHFAADEPFESADVPGDLKAN